MIREFDLVPVRHLLIHYTLFVSARYNALN